MYEFTLAKEFNYKGFNCFIVNSIGGWRNGYVEIPKDNKFFGVQYYEKSHVKISDLEDTSIGKRGVIPAFAFAMRDSEMLPLDVLFNVHGSLTYSDDHLKPVGKENSWFLGFDTNHIGDAKDRSLMSKKHQDFYDEHEKNIFKDGEIRTENYIESELKSLVDQIIKYNN